MTINQTYFQKNKFYQSPWFWYFIFILFLLFGSIEYCRAEKKKQVVCDTVVISPEKIVDYITKETKNGNIRMYGVYKDENTLEILPISQSTFDYLKVCKKYNVNPYIAIRIRNKKAISIIKMPIKINENGKRNNR